MPIWDRYRRGARGLLKQVQLQEAEQQVVQAVRQDLAGEVDPRNSVAVCLMLGWLWGLSPEQTLGYGLLLGGSQEEAAWLAALAAEAPEFREDRPASPQERYAAVAAALNAYLSSQIVKESIPFGADTVHLKAGIRYAIRLIRLLRMTEVHEIVCRLLIATNRAAQIGASSGQLNHLGGRNAYDPLKDEIAECLLALPADQIPGFWRRTTALGMEGHFFWIVAHMRDRRAVAPMLEAFPRMSQDMQGYAISAMRNIGDMRAVPVLQEIAADPENFLAPVAAHAISEILRESRDDAAILLRPTDSRHAGNAGETLLRAAAATDSTPRADELLRAGSQPSEEKNEEP